MKKTIYISAAILALAACSKTGIENISSSEGTAFEKGQEVTLTVNSGANTKVNGTLDPSDGSIDFKWESNDIIKVTVGGTSAPFRFLKTTDDGASAEFVGFMPASGSTFDVQYPYDTPDLASQEYVANGLPHNKMLATATGCSLGSPFTLTPQNAALRLNLYGLEREITKIAVTNTTASKTYTLTCSPAVQVGADSGHATAFFIVVPAGNYSFKANITSNDIAGAERPKAQYPVVLKTGTKITRNEIATTSSKPLSAGVVYGLSTTNITTIWAPVNCGYDDSHKYGLLYQFGRKAGCGYNGETPIMTSVNRDSYTTDSYISNPADNLFYWSNTTGQGTGSFDDRTFDWYTSSRSRQRTITTWPQKSSDTGYVAGKIDNPCPSGWRVPTKDEFNTLFAGNTSPAKSTNDGIKGFYLNGTSTASSTGIFLPRAGYRIGPDGNFENRESTATYWTSTINSAGGTDNPEYSWCFTYNGSTAGFVNDGWRSQGRSVRCVYDQNYL